MALRFRDLAIGQPFWLGGIAYIKTSPLAAAPRDGGATRLVARSETVAVEADEVVQRKISTGETLSPNAVRSAIDSLYEEAQRQLENCGADGSSQAAVRECRVRILQHLGLPYT